MRRRSPYSDPTWARASENLAKIIAGNPVQDAQYAAALTDVKSTQQADRFARGDRSHRMSSADALDSGDVRSFLTNQVRADGDLSDLGSVIQTYGGNELAQGRATPDQMRGWNSGAGNIPDADSAYTMAEGNAISARDARESRAETLAKQRMIEQGELRQKEMGIAGTLEGMLAGQVQSGDRTMEDAYLIHDRPTTDEYVAIQAGAEGLGADQTERLGENLSLDQALSQDYQMGNLSVGDIGKYRYGHGWPNDLDTGGSGSGAGGDAGPMDPLDMNRLREANEGLADAFGNYMIDIGGPTTDGADGGTVYDYASTPKLESAVLQLAADAREQDRLAGRAPAPDRFYVEEAANTLGVSVQDGTDQGALWFDEPNSVSWSGQGQQQPQQQSNQPPTINSNDDAAYEALPSGTVFFDENGKRYQKP